MVRRINAFSSSRLLWTALFLATCAMLARSQSTVSTQQHSGAASSFLIAPTLAVPAAPTSVAVGDLDGDGVADLVITQKGSGKVTVLLGDGKGGFEPGVEYAAGAAPAHVLLKDLAGHGRLSIVVTDEATGAIDVLRGNGDGTFRKADAYPAIAHPVAIAAGDFSGNERVELAVASATGIALMASDGDGKFWLGSNIPLSHEAVAITAADLKGNGHRDLVAANADGTLTVLLNDGSGHFHALPAAKIASAPLTAIAAGDFRGDGRTDLAVTAGKTNQLIVLLGKGDGRFEPGVHYTVGNSPAAVLVADLKGDGGSDLITVNQAANTFSVLLGKRNGAFEPSIDFTAGNSPIALAAADFNGDGRADLAILNAGDATISLPLGHGDGTFQAAPSYRSQLEQKSIAAGDLRGTGRSDLVVTNFCGSEPSCKGKGSADVFFANLDGSYKHADSYALGFGPVAVALADLNGDKKIDLIAVNQNGKTLMVLPGMGKGKFGEPQTYALAASPRALFVGDFNGDGRPDVAIATDCGRKACSEPGSLDIWLGRADGKLALAQSYMVGYSPDSIAGGDLRGTGHLDLLVANRCGDDGSCKSKGTASLLKGDGKGRFGDGGEIELGNAPSAIAIGNVSGNGLDLIVAEGGTNIVEVMHGDGRGGFGVRAQYRVGEEPSSLAIADFNGDRLPDVAVANFKSATVNVLYGTAKGTLRRATAMPVGSGPEALVAVPNGKSGVSNLVTANGNGGVTPMGTDITLLKVHSDAKTPTTVNPVNAATNPDTVDVSEVLSATVNGAAGTAPTGTVTFTSGATANIICSESTDNPKDDVVPFSSSDNVSGTAIAACTTVSLAGAAGDTITATYSGDSTYNGNSGTLTLDINASGTTTTVTAPAATSGEAASLVITATVAPPTIPSTPADAVSIGGTGTFLIDGSPATCTENSGDQENMSSSGATASAKCTIAANSLSDGLHFLSTSFSSSNSSNFSGSSGFTFITVGGTSTTTITFSASPTVDAPVTITATVTKKAGGSGTPSGSVTFTGTAPGCGSPSVVVPMTAGAAQCTPTASSLASTTGGTKYSVTATYNPDSASAYLTSNSTQSLAVAQATPTTTVTSAPATPTVDVPFTLTATVKPPSGTSVANEVPIGGTVTFKNGGATIAGCTTASSVSYDVTSGFGTATCTPTTLSAFTATNGTPDAITATYSGDGNYFAGSAGNDSLTINKETTTTTLTASTNPSAVGQSVTFTATIAPPTGVTASVAIGGAGETVSFTDNGTTISGCGASAVTFSAGVATAQCVTPFTTSGSHPIVAQYTGDSNYTAGSPSNTITQNVGSGFTTTTVSAAATGNVNTPVTVNATVTPNTASTTSVTGTVAFFLDGAQISACQSQPVTSVNPPGGPDTGTASCTGVLVPGGSHKFTASYTPLASPPPVYSASGLSAAATIAMTLSQISASVSTVPAIVPPATSAASLVNAQVTLNAAILPSPQPSPATNIVAFLSSDTVSFLDGSTLIAGCINVPIAVTSTGASASCPTSLLKVGAHSINARFNGDTSYNSGTSAAGAPLTESVNNTTTTLSASPSPASLGQNVTFTATVVPNSGPTNPPGVAVSGTVTFMDTTTSTNLCPPSVTLSSGTATCQTSTLAAESHSVTATFNPTDSNYATSNNSTTELVSASLITTTLGVPPSTTYSGTSTVNQAVVLTDSITPITGHTPSGTVTFTSNGNAISEPSGCGVNGVVPISTTANGGGFFTATCTTFGLPEGSNKITATYFDTTFGSGVATGTQTVSPAATTFVSIAAPASSVVVNSQISLTASVFWGGSSGTPKATAVPAGGVPIVGSVTFNDTTNSTQVSGCAGLPVTFNPLTGVATALCKSNVLAGGSHSITATFTPSATDLSYFASAASAAVTQIMTSEPTSTKSVTASPSPAAVDQPVTFSATVTINPGGVPLAGSVAFTASSSKASAALCSSALQPSGVATCTVIPPLPAGAYTVTATFTASNSANFASSSEGEPLTIGQTFTTTKFVSPPTTSTVDKTITLTAKVTPAFTNGKSNGESLSGLVAFQFNGNAIAGTTGACSAVKVSPTTGEASCTAATLPAGDDTVTATYYNDANFAGSSGSATVAVSTAVFSSVTLATSSPAIIAGGPVTFTFTAHPPAGFATISALPVPVAGEVTFFVNNAPITGCTNPAAVDAKTGVATCTATTLPNGTPTITAVYSNVKNSNYAVPKGQPSKVTQTVRDFSLLVSANPPVIITHGSTSANDPIAPNAVTVTPISTQSFNQPITISYSAKALHAPAGAVVPIVTFPNGKALNVQAGGAQQPLPIVIDATAATPGTYTVTISGTADIKDSSTSKARALTHPAINVLTVYVSSSVKAGSIVTGKSVNATVDFVLPPGVALTPAGPKGNWCTAVYGLSLQTPVPPSQLGITCTANRASIPAEGSTQVAPLTIHISTSSTPPGAYDILIKGTGVQGKVNTNPYEAVIKVVVTL